MDTDIILKKDKRTEAEIRKGRFESGLSICPFTKEKKNKLGICRE
jgi:hypothetical protein